MHSIHVQESSKNSFGILQNRVLYKRIDDNKLHIVNDRSNLDQLLTPPEFYYNEKHHERMQLLEAYSILTV